MWKWWESSARCARDVSFAECGCKCPSSAAASRIKTRQGLGAALEHRREGKRGCRSHRALPGLSCMQVWKATAAEPKNSVRQIVVSGGQV